MSGVESKQVRGERRVAVCKGPTKISLLSLNCCGEGIGGRKRSLKAGLS